MRPVRILLFGLTLACGGEGATVEPTSPEAPQHAPEAAAGEVSSPVLEAEVPAPTPEVPTMFLSADAFDHQREIPKKFTCQGDDLSPALSWGDLPAGTASLALIVDDPDAPDPAAPKMTWVHWVLYDLPATSTGSEAVAPGDLPAGTREGTNDWKRTGYGGPCPPIGRHRYFHKLYALDVTLGDLGPLTKAELLTHMEGHVLAQVEVVGTYQKF